MKYKDALLLIALLTFMSSCAPKRVARQDSGDIIKTDRFAYVQDDTGRFYVLTSTPQALNEAMKTIHPGPSNVDRVDVWVITPLKK